MKSIVIALALVIGSAAQAEFNMNEPKLTGQQSCRIIADEFNESMIGSKLSAEEETELEDLVKDMNITKRVVVEGEIIDKTRNLERVTLVVDRQGKILATMCR